MSKKKTWNVLKLLLEPFRPSDQAEIDRCLASQGGIDTCRLVYYKDKDLGNDGVWDNWRLEGPAFVWHFPVERLTSMYGSTLQIAPRSQRMPDCCIVGGGVIGLSIARELAGRGRSVTVVSHDTLRKSASWAAAGIFPAQPRDTLTDYNGTP